MAIAGLDKFMQKIKEVERATAALDGEIASISFDPNDPQSIELAIQAMETEIDQRVAEYRNNDMVEEIVVELKESCRQAILDRADSGRAEGGA